MPAATTPFDSHDRVDVPALQEQHREDDRGRRARLRGQRHDGRGRRPGARGAPRGGRCRRGGRRRARPRRRRRVVRLRRRLAGLRRRRGRRGGGRDHVPAAAGLPRRPGRGRRVLLRRGLLRTAADGLQQPGGLRRGHACRPGRAHLRGGRGRGGDQGVLGRHPPDPGAAALRDRRRCARGRRRLGARGLLRRRDRLGDRRRRRGAARGGRAVRPLPRRRPGGARGRVPSDPARCPLRHDAQARPVLQGRPGRRGLRRRADPAAAAAAHRRRARRARGRARGAPRRGAGGYVF